MKFQYSLFAMALSIVAHTSIIGTTSATESANAIIQKEAKDANQKGNSVIEALSHRKRLCWDGNDPDESVQTDYVSMKLGLIVVEASVRMGAIAHHTPPALDRLIEFRLAVADAALNSNCLKIADEQYRAVLKNDPEVFFERYRDLAKIGVDDVRERRAAQFAYDEDRRIVACARTRRALLWRCVKVRRLADRRGCRPCAGASIPRVAVRADAMREDRQYGRGRRRAMPLDRRR